MQLAQSLRRRAFCRSVVPVVIAVGIVTLGACGTATDPDSSDCFANSIVISPDRVEADVGKTVTLGATVSLGGPTDQCRSSEAIVGWESLDTTFARVEYQGAQSANIVTVAPGTARIVAKTG